MHELGITDHLLNLALRHAHEAGATRITRLNLVIGEFSSVVDESIKFYWDMMTKGTIAAGSELSFERIRGLLQCGDCEAQFYMQNFHSRCPACGGSSTTVIDGDQFKLSSIEIEGGTQ